MYVESARPGDLCAALSRELHDHVAHLIAAGLTGLELSDQYSRTGRTRHAHTKLCNATAALREALDTTKRLAAGLRRPDRTALTSTGGGRHTGTGTVPTIDPDEVFLILREAVDNALTHAQATNIHITVSAGSGVRITVEDDGVGIGPRELRSPMSLGLASMRERAAMLDGDLTISAAAAGGTRVLMTVPAAERP